jgi:hypothetical protein
MIFRFVVKYLGFFKHVPLLPLLFDALITVWNFAFNRELIKAITFLEETVSTWSGLETSLHRFGGIQFNVQGQEIGHIHSNGVLDILLNRKIKHSLLRNKEAEDHHTFPGSGWITYKVNGLESIDQALKLLRMSYDSALRVTPNSLESSSPHYTAVKSCRTVSY